MEQDMPRYKFKIDGSHTDITKPSGPPCSAQSGAAAVRPSKATSAMPTPRHSEGENAVREFCAKVRLTGSNTRTDSSRIWEIYCATAGFVSKPESFSGKSLRNG